MVQEQFFPAFQLFDPEVKHFYQKNTLKNSQMHIQLVKIILKHKTLLAKNLLRKESQLWT